MTNTNNQNTALQVINFDFYGDNLIALQDNATVKSTLQSIQFLEELDLQTKTKYVNDVINGSMTL